MNCPMCDAEIVGFARTNDVQKLQHCPDGYDTIVGNSGFPVFVPRSGRVEESYVAGRVDFKLVPCQCPIDKFECISPGVFKFKAKDKNFRPVELTGQLAHQNATIEES